ncbi:peroxiredoxin-like family protein [Hahella aquimaris]|uniref:peroxiredoxin-like family protein n=1 Tax=Hahella sp. HNIBRBA332 TaxID=3015983 RepID=UPI00273C06DB|nr:peroxiredoxin-like family protein [Hahella sp. HNIBRBA332]WLQ15802.1 peroxiredoxin-like family protein [Hahella sp. HNIBRBA332]
MKPGLIYKIKAGDLVAPKTLTTIKGQPTQWPDPERLVHLQFRRFAGCPFCNMHMRAMTLRHAELVAAGIREIVVFHSSEASMQPFQGDAPFDVISDPRKKLYQEFGVGRSLRALIDPRAISAAIKGGARKMKTANPDKGESPLGLPADFLIAPDGAVVACKYGVHAYDQWSVDDVLEMARHFYASASAQLESTASPAPKNAAAH